MLIDVQTGGSIRPRTLIWEDGSRYNIDRVKFAKRAASLKVGGCGMRYTVVKEGKERYLSEDEGRWFVEAIVLQS